MGNKCSCTHELKIEYNHCCKHECFKKYDPVKYHVNFRKDQQTQVIDSFKQYNVSMNINIQQISQWIMAYLPITLDYHLNRYENYNNLIIFCHEPSFEAYCDRNKSLCSIWFNYISDKCAPTGHVKILILGEDCVGKTSLIVRKAFDIFYKDINHDERSFDDDEVYQHLITIDEKTIPIQLCIDTSDKEEFTNGNSGFYYRNSKIYLLLFACNSQKSFDNIKHYKDKILQWNLDMSSTTQHWAMILVETKCDLRDENDNKYVFVDTKDAINLAKEWEIPYIQISAKSNTNVKLLFEIIFYEYWMQSQSFKRINNEGYYMYD
eukprot:292583_1